jgi:hypothetical protein
MRTRAPLRRRHRLNASAHAVLVDLDAGDVVAGAQSPSFAAAAMAMSAALEAGTRLRAVNRRPVGSVAPARLAARGFEEP